MQSLHSQMALGILMRSCSMTTILAQELESTTSLCWGYMAREHHLSSSSDCQCSVSHAHAIQPFACNICDCAITVHHKPIPAKQD